MARQAAARSGPAASARLASKNQWLSSPDANRTGSSKYRNPFAFTASSSAARSSVTWTDRSAGGRRPRPDGRAVRCGGASSPHHDDRAGDAAGVGVGEGGGEVGQGEALGDERLQAQLAAAVQ